LQLTLKVCAAAENCKRNTKTPYFGGSKSFKVINVKPLKSLSTVIVMFYLQALDEPREVK